MSERTPLALICALAATLAPLASVRAEPPPGGYAEPAPQAQPAYAQPVAQPGTAQPAYGQPAQQPQYEQQPATAQQGRGVEYGAHLFVPLWLSQPGSGVDVKPGIGLQGRIGWEFPSGWSAEIDIGYMFNGLSASEPGVDAGNLDGFWLGAGLRYSVLNRTAWVPFFGVGLQLIGWGDPSCSGCARDYTLGAVGTLGLIFEVSEFLGIELGAQGVVSTAGDAFDGLQVIVSPLAGLTLYY